MKRLYILVLSLVLGIFVPFTIASATLVNDPCLGGKWAGTNPNISVYYYSSYYRGYGIQAQNAWNNCSNHFDFYETTNEITAKVAVWDGNNQLLGTGVNGLGTPGPNSQQGTYTYGDVYINRDSLILPGDGTLTGIVCIHEYGHIMGLAHNDVANDECPIMISRNDLAMLAGTYVPKTPDTNTINNTLYPGY